MDEDLPDAYIEARQEARRFLLRLSELEERLATDDYARKYVSIIGCKETAAVKRASLDLSRSLAKLRKGGYTWPRKQ